MNWEKKHWRSTKISGLQKNPLPNLRMIGIPSKKDSSERHMLCIFIYTQKDKQRDESTEQDTAELNIGLQKTYAFGTVIDFLITEAIICCTRENSRREFVS